MTYAIAHILLFDGHCNFCSNLIQFLIKQDKKALFRYAALQSEQAQALLKKFNLPRHINSVVYIKGDECYQTSSAVLQIFKELGGYWKLLYAFIVVPKRLRDFIYNQIAKRRYVIWGRRSSCMLPEKDRRLSLL